MKVWETLTVYSQVWLHNGMKYIQTHCIPEQLASTQRHLPETQYNLRCQEKSIELGVQFYKMIHRQLTKFGDPTNCFMDFMKHNLSGVTYFSNIIEFSMYFLYCYQYNLVYHLSGKLISVSNFYNFNDHYITVVASLKFELCFNLFMELQKSVFMYTHSMCRFMQFAKFTRAPHVTMHTLHQHTHKPFSNVVAHNYKGYLYSTQVLILSNPDQAVQVKVLAHR